MSTSLFAILLFWVSSSSAATRPLPLSVTWYSPVSARSQRAYPMAADDTNNNSGDIPILGSNSRSLDAKVMKKSTSILYDDQLPLTSLRLNKIDEDWLQNNWEPDMEDMLSDTDTNPASQQELPEPRNPIAMSLFNHLENERSKKRADGHSLSVTNSVDVLRQNMLKGKELERQRQNQNQIDANAQFLKEIGKRQVWYQQPRWLRAWDTSKGDLHLVSKIFGAYHPNQLENPSLPLPMMWYSPVKARPQKADLILVDDSNDNGDIIDILRRNVRSEDNKLVRKCASILCGDQLRSTPLRLHKMDDDWLKKTGDVDMEDTLVDTNTNPVPMQGLPEPRDMGATSLVDHLEKEGRRKRVDGYSLSVTDSVDVLRRNMLNKQREENMRQLQNQIDINDQILREKGKRQIWYQQTSCLQV